MSASKKLSIIGLSLATVAVGLTWSGLSAKCWFNLPEFRKADVFLSTVPQSSTDAQEACPIPLPAAASNVQYAVWSFGQVTQSWIRFEAPVAACLAHAENMMNPFRHREGYAVTRTPISEDTGVLCVLDPTEVDLSWFEECQESTGSVFRADGGRAPVIWVDTDRGRFYCEVKNACHSMCAP